MHFFLPEDNIPPKHTSPAVLCTHPNKYFIYIINASLRKKMKYEKKDNKLLFTKYL